MKKRTKKKLAKKTFTIDCGPGTNWKVRVIVWPTHKRLIQERRRIERTCNEPLAFFRDLTYNETVRAKNWKSNIIGECHFFSGEGLKTKTIIHEATHAAIAFAYMARLDVFVTRDGEEEFVKSVEHLSGGIMWGVRQAPKE